ncbi:MAG: histidine kinase [Saprospiraceae bacterium]|nr:histidine kinase [Saprospiraceae bacterium]
MHFRRLLLHILLWSAYAAIEIVANWPHYDDKQELFRQTIWYLPVIALPFYLIAYVLVPRLLWRQRKALFWLLMGGICLLVLLFRLEWTHWYYMFFYQEDIRMPLAKFSKNLIRDYSVIALGVCLKIIHDWDRKDRLTQQLSGEKRDAELQFLRAQIHPHFLFNTLNNLYGLALQQSPHTGDYILKISGLLDFILYECSDEKIPVYKEWDLIEQYISLERLRYSAERLDLQIQSTQIPGDCYIAPLILLPFVENAFKHASTASGERIRIKIDLYKKHRSLYFQVENSHFPAPSPTLTHLRSAKGLGLKNVEKRLHLLYPEKHRLQKIQGKENYLIALQIDF